MVSCRVCKTSFEAGSYRDELCPGCGALVPVSLRLCPCCTLPFEQREAFGRVIDECARCGGVFLDHNTHKRIFSSDAFANAVLTALSQSAKDIVPAARAALACPACTDPMQRKLSEGGAGIVLDVCALHGTFFDGGELPALVDFQRRAGERSAIERQRDDAATRSKDWSLKAPAAVLGPLLYGAMAIILILAKTMHC